MCGIAVRNLKRQAYYTDEMGHRGLLTHRKEFGCLELIHEHLPIQVYDSAYPIIQSERYDVLFNGEIFEHDETDDIVFLTKMFRDESFRHVFDIVEELKNLDGFYSFIVIDKQENKVYAFTDPLGKKQLYYNPGFGIASEIRGVSDKNSKLDRTYFGTILKHGYTADNRTPLQNVKRLLPNTVYTFDVELTLHAMMENYYDFFAPIVGVPFQSMTSNQFIYDTMEKSVKNRLIGHHRVALLLSGGLDSAIIHHHLKCAKNVSVYTVNNGEDYQYAKALAPEAQLVNFTQFGDDLKMAIHAQEMPMDLGSMIPQFKLCSAINERVIMTGDGADEIFGGYRRMAEYDAQVSDIFDELRYYHLVRLDRMSMWFTKELRSPFLNLDLIKFALTLPHEDRIDKKFLRNVYRGILPMNIVNRPKEPLKIDRVKKDPYEYRKELITEYLNQRKLNGQGK